MISIITCSVRPERLAQLKENIRETIGAATPYELIAIDNASGGRSIAAAYNYGASQAKYPCLLFIHEDAGFITHNWGEEIIAKLADPECGVIGFAGCKIMYKIPGGWGMDPQHSVINLVECGKKLSWHSDPSVPFTRVISLDGFALFCRRDVWAEFPFDEKAITGFHCYDIDFTITIAQKYANYVCNDILPYHNSAGNFDKTWLEATMKIFEEKWQYKLPMTTPELNLTPSQLTYHQERAYFRSIKNFKRLNLPTRKYMKEFLKYPLTPRHAEHLVKLLFM